MNIFEHIRVQILTALDGVLEGIDPSSLPLDAVTAEPPRDPSHGDVATNAAMVLSKPLKRNPRDIAEKLIAALQTSEDIAAIEIAGPGFINISLKPSVWAEVVRSVIKDGNSTGNSSIGTGKKVNIEYVSANPTGPMHIGHARGAVVGDAIARLMIKAGFDVTKEYYINDAGAQVDVLARSAYLRYREALGESITIPEGLYPGDYLKIVGESFAQEHGRDYLSVDESVWLPALRDFALESMMVLIKRDLLDLGVEHDVFTSEKALVDAGMVEQCITHLTEKGLVYQGVLEPPKGKTPEDWEPREQTLFRTTDAGDDVDRPLKKSDGSYTYFASDIAYHHDKIQRGFNHMVLCLGADHGGYVKRMKSAVAGLSNHTANIDIILYQLVNYIKNGESVKMSKRAGNFTTVRDVIDAVGKDALRFIMLTRKSGETLDFDLEKATEQSRDNPVFYVQYAHARARSVLRNAGQDMPSWENTPLTDELLTLLSHESEQALIRQIAGWPRIVETAARTVEPHRIAFYLQDIAGAFHSLWNAGRDNPELRFIIPEEPNATHARLAMVKATAITLASGLETLGAEPVMEM